MVVSEAEKASHEVVLLVDSSESMSLAEEGGTRYEKLLRFLRANAGPRARTMKRSTCARICSAATSKGGRMRTALRPCESLTARPPDLGGAIAHGLQSSPHPLAVIALTDGVANESDNNNAALGALMEGGTPFIGVGIGRDIPR